VFNEAAKQLEPQKPPLERSLAGASLTAANLLLTGTRTFTFDHGAKALGRTSSPNETEWLFPGTSGGAPLPRGA
jgi:hypothetical protein